jgi:predicted RNase H-like nuclease (RuvC/YqgF family)
LVKNEYGEAAQKFAEQIAVSLADVDPEGNRLEIKWKSILTLQKKITALEEENSNLKKELENVPSKKASLPLNS